MSFDATLSGLFGSDVATIVNQVILWIFGAGVVISLIGGAIAIVLGRMSVALTHNTEKYEQIKRAEKTIIISICIIAGVCVVGVGLIWVILGIVSGDKLADAVNKGDSTSSTSSGSTNALILQIKNSCSFYLNSFWD